MPMPSTGIIMLWLLSGIAIINSCVNGYDGSMMNGMQSLYQWQSYFNTPDGPTLGLLNAIFNAGGTVGVFFAPFVTDRLGRRWGIAIGSAIILVGVILQSAAQSIHQFIGGRFVIGYGLAISSNAAPILVAELAHPHFRGTITGLYNTQWALGSIIAAWVTFGTFSIDGQAAWRIPSAVQAAPSVILLIFLPLMPESPRWLVDKGKADQARAILGKLHGNGNPQDPLVNLEMEEIEEAIRFEREHEKVSYLELVATPGNRYRMFLGITVGLFSQWSGNGLISYYLFKVLDNIGITDSKTQLLINGGLSIYSWILANTGAFITDRMNRRPQFLASTIGMMLSFAALTAATGVYNEHGNAAAGIAVIVLIFVYSAAYSLAWTALTCLYPTEIMPYHIRAKGLAVSSLAVNLALFFNSYVNPIGLDNIGWKYYFVYVAWLPVEVITIFFFYKETKGRTLEELAVIFDGEAAAVHGNIGEGKGLHVDDEKASTEQIEKGSSENFEVAPINA
ncbi:general substrate transporter [Calocera viscosa TUFC12733]|uniref:General substrate transporter n=1 Tax=Calocera viscosa (strain TUFC12733) TaxID=1330018 RepID=A0A167MBR5_CALVF|nr:general substrate transporter [Calocera viscosa TUFC12733]